MSGKGISQIKKNRIKRYLHVIVPRVARNPNVREKENDDGDHQKKIERENPKKTCLSVPSGNAVHGGAGASKSPSMRGGEQGGRGGRNIASDSFCEMRTRENYTVDSRGGVASCILEQSIKREVWKTRGEP